MSQCLYCLCLNFLFNLVAIAEATPHPAERPPKTTETVITARVLNKETLVTPDTQLTVLNAYYFN